MPFHSSACLTAAKRKENASALAGCGGAIFRQIVARVLSLVNQYLQFIVIKVIVTGIIIEIRLTIANVMSRDFFFRRFVFQFCYC